MKHHQISGLDEEEYFSIEPTINENQIKRILINMYLSRLDIDYLSRIDILEVEVYSIKEEIKKMKKMVVENPLSFLSQKLSLRGNFAVLKKETFDVLLITDSEREAFEFSLKEPNSMILRLK